MCLCSIFKYYEAMLLRDGHDRVHISHLAIQVNGNDRFRARGDRIFKRRRIHCEGDRINVTKLDRGARVVDRRC